MIDRLVPSPDLSRFDIDLDNAVEKTTGRLNACTPDETVRSAGDGRIVDGREFQPFGGEFSAIDGSIFQRNPKPRQHSCHRDRLAGAKRRQVKILDHVAVGICHHVHDDVIAVLKGVHMVKSKSGIARGDRQNAAVSFSTIWKRNPRSGSQR